MPLSYKKMSETEWRAMPETQSTKKPNEWADLVDELQNGQPVSLDIPADRNVKGVRIAIARLAATKEMKLQFRQKGQTLAMRRSETPYTPRPRAAGGRRGASRRGSEQP
jgi:hypothetical protein